MNSLTHSHPAIFPERVANQRWLQCGSPFTHFVAQNVFVESAYRTLETAFRELLAKGLSDSPDATRFSRMKGYSAYWMAAPADASSPFRIFTSREWHDLLVALTGIASTGDINAELHHHPVASASGRPHNDLNPGWFLNYRSEDEIILSRHYLCNYKTGEVYKPGLTVHEAIRGLAMIFYLNNEPWNEGDGGETGLYQDIDDDINTPADTIPPLSNSLLLFECTPRSFHGFISNRRHPRNSLIMWIHRSKAEVVSRWGEQEIVYWQKERKRVSG